MRHKLVPTRGRKLSRFVASLEQAEEEAQEWFADTGIPVMIVEAPKDGPRRVVSIVGDHDRPRRGVR